MGYGIERHREEAGIENNKHYFALLRNWNLSSAFPLPTSYLLAVLLCHPWLLPHLLCFYQQVSHLLITHICPNCVCVWGGVLPRLLTLLCIWSGLISTKSRGWITFHFAPIIETATCLLHVLATGITLRNKCSIKVCTQTHDPVLPIPIYPG